MIIKVPNISFLQYYNLTDRDNYNYYLKYADIKPKDIFNLGKFIELSFGFVKDLQELYNSSGFIMWNDLFNEIEKLTGKNKDKLSQLPLFDLHAFRLYLYEEIEEVNKRESANLSHKASAEETIAGLDEFGKYKAFLQFDKLAGGDILKIDEVRKLPYSICFTKLLLEAERTEFEKRLINIRKK